MRRLLVTSSVVRSSPILLTLMMEELVSSETSVLTRGTQRNIPEDAILQFWSSSGIYKWIIILIFHQVISRSVTLLKFHLFLH
jgi:hypothetical protein